MTHKNHAGDATVPCRPDGAPAVPTANHTLCRLGDPAGRCKVSSGPDGAEQPCPRDSEEQGCPPTRLTEQTRGSSKKPGQRSWGLKKIKDQKILIKLHWTHINKTWLNNVKYTGKQAPSMTTGGSFKNRTSRSNKAACAAAPRHLPRSVLGPARSCLNLSSREASLSLNAELLRVLGSDAPRSATVAECGRDWDLCRGAVLLVLSAERDNRG